ncbi:uncharacterized protein LOC119078161 [Bradysia coprophila]|uniref:uncharacterized protein LOC119078161 n=1 Tax=Bradysia coprophila TaxID=38358 RepID=UPI00187DA48C|nr:uncharacterized protein LOC119078161 [Bradysia coprophila]
MLSAHRNITTSLILQYAIGVLLDKIGLEINSHATCVITDGNSHHNEVHLNHLPAVRGDCHENVFINQVQHGVAAGCSFFVVSEECVTPFLNNFRQIHDWVDQKYEKKVLVVADTERVLSHQNIMDILTHQIVINELPLTLLLQPNVNNEWICVWSAYPFESYFLKHNRFFVGNLSFEYNKQIIPKITDLNGLPVTGAFMSYPPFSYYERVPSGSGNAQLFNSNESRPINLDGQECLIILEFCRRYNCTLTARLDYDEATWGEVYDNQTGNGLLFVKKFTVKSIPELRELVRQKRVAITMERMQHGTLSYLSYLERESSKNYMVMKQPMYWQYTTVMASKTWPFMEQLSRIVLLQQESGLQRYWEYLVNIFIFKLAVLDRSIHLMFQTVI